VLELLSPVRLDRRQAGERALDDAVQRALEVGLLASTLTDRSAQAGDHHQQERRHRQRQQRQRRLERPHHDEHRHQHHQ
jgi:hypothetical protein